ncbi:MAG: hypothetical protein H6740_28950, partial [Alphaproteobacteria bacterium]|nr:hypothetical protein [Alphaproteobacteria bacterium]
LLAACPAPSTGDPLDDWVTATGQDFQDCGHYELGQCGDEAITEAEQAVVDCILDAQAGCAPAHAWFSRPTIEGDPITTHWFVLPEDEGCSISMITDTREDAFGAPAVWHQRCDEVEALERCPWLENGDCEDATRLE